MGITREDWDFIKTIEKRLPEKGLKKQFSRVLAHPAGERIDVAKSMLEQVPRADLVAEGIEPAKVQSVARHTEQVVYMFDHIWAHSHHRQVAMAKLHDLHEAVTGSLSADAAITREDKAKLDEIAAKVIFESSPKELGIWKEYRAQETEVARETAEYEALAKAVAITAIVKDEPTQAYRLRHYWRTASEKLHTKTGAEMYSEFISNHHTVGCGGKAVSRFYEQMEERGLLSGSGLEVSAPKKKIVFSLRG